MADDEQFSLCWNNFNTNLSAGFHESLLRGDLVDVTLAAEGQLVKAHRLILSVCSPYFRKMLTQVPATQHAFIFLKDVSHSALKDLIQFMYCGEVNVKQDALPAFISTAEALQIKGLTETGDSAPAQQSPAKEVIAAPPATISVPIATATGGSPRTKVQRTRVHSYKLESEESGDDKVQIQAGSSHHVTAQQVQQQTQHTTTQKRTLQQRTVIPIQPSKRTKLSVASVEALEAPEATPQVQTVQIVKQVLEPDYVEIPIESINAKAEPEYADETGEIETVETEAEQEHTLTEHEQSVEQEQADDDGNYVEDEYAEMGKFEESYFTEGEDAKAGASGFGDSYTSDGGTGTEQSAQVQRTDLYADASQLPPPSTTKKPPMNATELKFIKSPWSTPCLVLDNYLYNCHSTRGDIGYWRCHNYSRKVKEERCRARCVIKCGRLSALTGAQHNHPPHTEKIDRIMRRNYADEQMQECQQQQQQEQHQQEQIYHAASDTNRNREMIMLVAANTANRNCREAVVEVPVELAVVTTTSPSTMCTTDGNGGTTTHAVSNASLPASSSSVLAHLLTNGIKLDDYTLPVVEM
ncbi:modifier of mdg4-like isoform X1 [Anopheles ziemanni]|uniref:modifier of mdg4-like isoform X2 n=1 Tax=Anopheles coustani TaxID=139045 RepID=UPI00265988A7|nr:modifier of mdg4-like isoform X2 [Anopheles coustani]XP_058170959.1 modifier of mdg4-like isoform X1 [Anopheles ziemanni]